MSDEQIGSVRKGKLKRALDDMGYKIVQVGNFNVYGKWFFYEKGPYRFSLVEQDVSKVDMLFSINEEKDPEVVALYQKWVTSYVNEVKERENEKLRRRANK